MAESEKILRGLPYIGLGLVLGAALFSGLAYLHRSEEWLCLSCHEMREPAESFRSSVHGHQAEGIVPRCTDCHKYSLIEAGINLFRHTTRHFSPLEERKARAMITIRDEGCRACHRDILSPSMTPQARTDHRLYLQGKGGNCLSCHEEEGVFHRRESLSK
ncbi:MAG: NapC/NirT family cytochrome c [candidate division WOR-3 bacterium]